MFRRRSETGRERRRGVILLVVLFLLTLFAIAGLTFVWYADAEARAARSHRDAQAETRPGAEPELLFSYFLGQLLYDVPDDERGIWSALRGHSLARNMFGMNYAIQPDGSLLLADNATPFSGSGRQRYDSPFPLRDDWELINYTYHAADGFLRDPERIGLPPRPGPRPPGLPDNRPPYLAPANAPYTYPDLNNLFLAALKAGPTALPGGGVLPPGTLLMPSFHRPWLFGRLTDIPNGPPGRPVNRNWITPEGKYLLLRPRPIDMGPGFPYPEDEGGDVKNLIGLPGYYDESTGRMHHNDSLWIDLGAPVLVAPNGRKYKALFAPLILDLDNRINLNVHGNLRGPGGTDHGSNQGWGPWEVNPGVVLNANPGEWLALLHGTGRFGGRYGLDSHPHSPFAGNVAPPVVRPRFYSPGDLDGSQELAGGLPTAPLRLSGTPRTVPFRCFPARSAGYGNGSVAERTGHPGLFHPFRPTGPDRLLPLANMEALLRHRDTGSHAFAGDLVRLCPDTFTDPSDPDGSTRRRHQVTLRSFDVDRPGISPWFWPAAPHAYNRLPAPGSPSPSPHPAGLPPTPPTTRPIHPDSEFSPDGPFGPDARTAAYVTGLRRLDLNRYLPAYPLPGPNGHIPLVSLPNFAVAQTARQHMAGEIYERLWRVTGAGTPALLAPPGAAIHDPERWEAHRRLAQLAVNIVDYIDPDDYMTPFNWYPPYPANLRGEWLHGTELPRVVINEAYVEYGNDPSDPGLRLQPPRATRHKGNVWVELYNSFQDDPPITAPWHRGAAQLEVPESAAGAGDNYGVYQLLIADLNHDIRQPDNVRGDVAPNEIRSQLDSFSPERDTTPAPLVDTRFIQPANPAYLQGYFGNPAENQGFYVVGPHLDLTAETDPFPLLPDNRPIATLRRSEMSYPVPALNASAGMPRPSILLQRLACPHLRPNPADPRLPVNPLLPYNPYITVDYVLNVFAHYAAPVGPDGPDTPLRPTLRSSFGRRQPYAGHPTQLHPQAPQPAQPDQPRHSFFQHNVDAAIRGPNYRQVPRFYPPFDWLIHPDRPLISPMELLHVSAYKPHELTQEFLNPTSRLQPLGHRAPWFDEDLVGANPARSHRLHRALEFFTTHNFSLGTQTAGTTADAVPAGTNLVQPRVMAGVSSTGGSWQIEAGSSLVIDRGRSTEEVVRVRAVLPGPPGRPVQFLADFLRPHPGGMTIMPTVVSERLPGKINLNTVWDEEVFQALCDAQLSNSFNAGNVTIAFQQLKNSRTLGGEAPGPDDRPFLSLAAGQTPQTDARQFEGGLKDTFLRPTAASNTSPLILSAMRHPHQQFELLTKIFNQVTVRSNVFAVWLTVGFFEVTDDTTRPVKLGAELGRAEGRHVRHRMFAIVDRSVLLRHPGPQGDFDPRAARSPGASGRVVPYLSIID